MTWVIKATIFACCVAGNFLMVGSLNNGVGIAPAMGVNTWNSLRCDGVTAANIMGYADKLIELGLRDKGYVYVNIDDCWSVGRDKSTNRLLPDPDAFPNGMKEVADYVHARKLKLGIYGDRGTHTCAGRPGSLGFEDVDAQTYAEWGIDYLKQDSCFATTQHKESLEQYSKMRDALNRTGRPILFSLCGWNAWYAPSGNDIGNSWRIGSDSDDWVHIHAAARTNEKLAQFSRHGGFNDPDMLVSSNSEDAIHITERQQRTQFSLWAIMAAPLIIGSNLLHLSSHDLKTLANRDAININQDILAIQGSVIMSNCSAYTIREQNPFKPWFYPQSKSKTVVWILVAISFMLMFVHGYFHLRWHHGPCCYAQEATDVDVNAEIELPNTPGGSGFGRQVSEKIRGIRKRSMCSTIRGCICVLTTLWFVCFCTAISLYASLDHIEQCQQIWFKRLSTQGGTDGALLLLNWASHDAALVCDESCLRKIGFKNGACVRNVWAMEENALSFPQQSIREQVPRDGGSFLFHLSQPSANAKAPCSSFGKQHF